MLSDNFPSTEVVNNVPTFSFLAVVTERFTAIESCLKLMEDNIISGPGMGTSASCFVQEIKMIAVKIKMNTGL